MTAASDDQIVEALGNHEPHEGTGGGVDCFCGWQDSRTDDYAGHLAEVIEPIIKAREAKAWEGGGDNALDGSYGLNPYRIEADE